MAEATQERRLLGVGSTALFGPIDVFAVKCYVLSLFLIEATNVAPRVETPLYHEALNTFICTKNLSVVREADTAFVKQAINMRREE